MNNLHHCISGRHASQVSMESLENGCCQAPCYHCHLSNIVFKKKVDFPALLSLILIYSVCHCVSNEPLSIFRPPQETKNGGQKTWKVVFGYVVLPRQGFLILSCTGMQLS
jgi:hypothetical protein